jgi:hypothetical protein
LFNANFTPPLFFGGFCNWLLHKEIWEAFEKDPNARIPPPPKDMDKIMYFQVPRIIAKRAEEIAKRNAK